MYLKFHHFLLFPHVYSPSGLSLLLCFLLFISAPLFYEQTFERLYSEIHEPRMSKTGFWAPMNPLKVGVLGTSLRHIHLGHFLGITSVTDIRLKSNL